MYPWTPGSSLPLDRRIFSDTTCILMQQQQQQQEYYIICLIECDRCFSAQCVGQTEGELMHHMYLPRSNMNAGKITLLAPHLRSIGHTLENLNAWWLNSYIAMNFPSVWKGSYYGPNNWRRSLQKDSISLKVNLSTSYRNFFHNSPFANKSREWTEW